jgi:aminoglycoside/choline kinase family phosphotransferase
LFDYLLKNELLDQALLLLPEIAANSLTRTYTVMADLFSRPFYIELKYKLATEYKTHSDLLATALSKVCPEQVCQGNTHGVKAMLMLLDLVK